MAGRPVGAAESHHETGGQAARALQSGTQGPSAPPPTLADTNSAFSLSLYERYGKMAQWPADRSARLNRITRLEAKLHERFKREPRDPAPDPRTVADTNSAFSLSLYERYGKMAQWPADRSARLNRITRLEAKLHERFKREPRDPAPDPRTVADTNSAFSGVELLAPVSSYPEELLAAAPGGLPSWDDVTVRYDYYKKRGYLRGLTLGDYVKWEEWWYKYEEWLKRERAYERWAEGEARLDRRHRRRKRGRRKRGGAASAAVLAVDIAQGASL